MTERSHPSLREPEASCDGFPSHLLDEDEPLFRFHRRDKGAWWFCSCGDHRFDLSNPLGACYLGGDELTAVLEVLGPDVSDQQVSRSFIDDRQLRKLPLPRAFSVADALHRKASGLGVTREIGTITPYDLPQQWARCFETGGLKGVRYGPRHDVAPGAWAVALFGRAGGRKSWRKGEVIPTGTIEQLLAHECDIRIEPIPSSAEVSIIDES